MSLNGALQIGRSALLSSQVAMQVAGDNMANAATKGYHRRSIHLSPTSGQRLMTGQFIGRGVQVDTIRREIDTSLQARYRDAISREKAALTNQRFLNTIESIQNELTDNDLSTLMSSFFNSFSELANNPTDNAVRSVVVQQGQSLADRISSMQDDYRKVMKEIDQTLDLSVRKANDILDQIARINQQIATTEGGGGGENTSLRDQRDLLIDELSEFMEVTVVEHPNGSADVLVNSRPVVLGTTSRGITAEKQSVDGQFKTVVRVKDDGTNLKINSGSIGALLQQREETVNPMIDTLDEFAGQLIFQVNRLHSQGQGKTGFDSLTGSYAIYDPNVQMNLDDAGVPFTIDNGSFFIHVKHKDTGTRTAHEISVNGDSMSLNDLIDQINTVVGVPNVTAELGSGNQLKLTAAAGYEFSFSDDTSGALAALGMNTFFTGTNATDIDVNQVIIDEPGMLAAGDGHVAGSNGTALAIADLQDVSLSELNGKSLREHWQGAVSNLAVKTDAANSSAESSRLVRESLDSHIQAVSGVSLDEEAINLLSFQRQFQAAARYINVVDETLQTLLSIA